MTEEEIVAFLESKLNLQMASIDEKGDPHIHLPLCRYSIIFTAFYQESEFCDFLN